MESIWLRNYVQPQLFVMFDSQESTSKKLYSAQMLELANMITSLEDYKNIIPNFKFEDGKWIYA